MTSCLVRGTGDVGSAVAYLLFSHGHAVIMHDVATPAHLRRGMSFVDALFDGAAQLEGLVGKRARDLDDLIPMARCGRGIPVFSGELNDAVDRLEPSVVIDARMRKRATPENARSVRYLTIGLGPNFTAGGNADLAIETAWGDSLGKVLTEGSTMKLEGEPRPIEGAGRERNVYAPRAGVLRTAHRIGQKVEQGEVVAQLAEQLIAAPLAGCIRGLSHDGVQVQGGTKIVEIDPRSDPATCFGLGERPKRIGEGVLAAIEMSGSTG